MSGGTAVGVTVSSGGALLVTPPEKLESPETKMPANRCPQNRTSGREFGRSGCPHSARSPKTTLVKAAAVIQSLLASIDAVWPFHVTIFSNFLFKCAQSLLLTAAVGWPSFHATAAEPAAPCRPAPSFGRSHFRVCGNALRAGGGLRRGRCRRPLCRGNLSPGPTLKFSVRIVDPTVPNGGSADPVIPRKARGFATARR